MIRGMKALQYEDRLNKLGIWSLEERRNRADIIEVFKILNGHSSVSAGKFFEMHNNPRTRGHSMKLKKNRYNSTARQHFFTERVINRWNKLSQRSIDAKNILEFKKCLTMEKNNQMTFFYDS